MLHAALHTERTPESPGRAAGCSAQPAAVLSADPANSEGDAADTGSQGAAAKAALKTAWQRIGADEGHVSCHLPPGAAFVPPEGCHASSRHLLRSTASPQQLWPKCCSSAGRQEPARLAATLLLALLLALPRYRLDSQDGTLHKPAAAGSVLDSIALVHGMASLLQQLRPAVTEARPELLAADLLRLQDSDSPGSSCSCRLYCSRWDDVWSRFWRRPQALWLRAWQVCLQAACLG